MFLFMIFLCFFYDSARRVSAGVGRTRRGGWEGSGEVCRLRSGPSRAAASKEAGGRSPRAGQGSKRQVCPACGRPCDAEEGAFHVMNFAMCARAAERSLVVFLVMVSALFVGLSACLLVLLGAVISTSRQKSGFLRRSQK